MKNLKGLFGILLLVILAALPERAAGLTNVLVWAQRYGATNQNENVRAMAVNSNGMVVVTGDGQSNFGDYATVGYSSSGIPLWTNTFDGAAHSSDTSRAAAIDDNGRAYVTGESATAGGSQCVTIAYDPDGTTAWSAPLGNGNGNLGLAMAVDHSGHVYVTGSMNYQMVTVAYTTGGVALWTNVFSGAVEGLAIDVDDNGNIYIAASAGTDIDTVAYSSAGNFLWARGFNGPANSTDDPNSIAVDHAGHVYVGGTSTGVGSDFDFVTLAYSTNGTALWTNRYNGSGNSVDRTPFVKAGPDGTVYVAGSSAGAVTGLDWTTIAYSTTGAPLWTNIFRGPGAGADWVSGVALDDASGILYVAGRMVNASNKTDFAVVAYSTAGLALQTNFYSGSGNFDDVLIGIGLDGSGNVYVSGDIGSQFDSGFGVLPQTDWGTLKFTAAPEILIPPASRTNLAGTTAVFTVGAGGARPLTYQWKKNGTNLVDDATVSGATTGTLTLAHVAVSDAGNYSVAVSNAIGALVSANATLVVIQPPILALPSWSPGTGFSCVVLGESNTLYRVEVSTNLVQWAPLALIAGFTEAIPFNDGASVNCPMRFYRVVKLP